MKEKEKITVSATIDAGIEKVWKYWTEPRHITNWNTATDEWHTPKAENDLKEGGRFVYRMEAKDGSFGFDFGGEYTEIREQELLAYKLDDGRKAKVSFEEKDEKVTLTEEFEVEDQNPVEMQKEGWQAILSNFKKYTESD